MQNFFGGKNILGRVQRIEEGVIFFGSTVCGENLSGRKKNQGGGKKEFRTSKKILGVGVFLLRRGQVERGQCPLPPPLAASYPHYQTFFLICAGKCDGQGRGEEPSPPPLFATWRGQSASKVKHIYIYDNNSY